MKFPGTMKFTGAMKFAGKTLSGIIRLYQIAVSPYLAMSCRFQPTCSTYAREAIAHHGPLRGGVLAVRRIARCQPWGGEGFDPVPNDCLNHHPICEPRQ